MIEDDGWKNDDTMRGEMERGKATPSEIRRIMIQETTRESENANVNNLVPVNKLKIAI